MTYKELSKYHENDIFIFRRGKDVTINTQKTLVDWYNRIPKNKRFKIKYVQRITLTLRIYELFSNVIQTRRTLRIIRMFSTDNTKYIRFNEDGCNNAYHIAICKRIAFKGEFGVSHAHTVTCVDEVQDFVRDWLNKECIDVHTLLNEFLKKPF